MSQVSENSGLPVLTAGNTVETLSGFDRDAVAFEEQVEVVLDAVEPVVTDTDSVSAEEALDEENSFDVSRAEFTELQDAFLRLYTAVQAYNKTAPHKILGI